MTGMAWVLTVSGLVAGAALVPSGGAAMMEEVERVDDAWNRMWEVKDAAGVDAMMTRDYVYIAPNGQVLDRAALLTIIRSPTYRIIKGSFTERSVTPAGRDAAVVTHRSQAEGTYDGKPFKDNHRCSRVYVKQAAGWRIVHEQCSPIGE